MDNKTFVIELISNGAWPVVVVTALIMFKDKLFAMFSGGLKSARHGDTELQFFETKQDVKNSTLEARDLEHLVPVDTTGLRKDVESKIVNQLVALESDEKIDILVKNLAQQQLILAFEKIYFNIYGSQIRLLEYLSVQSDRKATDSNVLEYYIEAKNQYPIPYGGIEYSDYMNFLVTWDLVKKENESWSLTKAGEAFLTFVTSSRYNKNKTL